MLILISFWVIGTLIKTRDTRSYLSKRHSLLFNESYGLPNNLIYGKASTPFVFVILDSSWSCMLNMKTICLTNLVPRAQRPKIQLVYRHVYLKFRSLNSCVGELASFRSGKKLLRLQWTKVTCQVAINFSLFGTKFSHFCQKLLVCLYYLQKLLICDCIW